MNKYPPSWKVQRLGTVFPKVVVGYVGNVNDHYCSEEEGVPFYRTLNIRNGYFRHIDLKYVTHSFNDKNKKSQIKNNDILIARVGANLGMVCKVKGLNSVANIANAIIIKSSLIEDADIDFFTYFLLSPLGKKQIFAGAAGGAQGVFNTKLTQEIKVPVPSFPEQQKIAKILSTWDKAISTTERLIENSTQQKKALMQQLLTGKKRLLDDNGQRFEGEWEEYKLGDITDFIRDGTHGTHERYESGVPMLSAKNITKQNTVDFDDAPYISEDDYNKIHARYTIESGDILLTVVGTLGRVALVPEELAEKFTLQRSVAIIRVAKGVCNQFLMQLFSSSDFTHLLHRKSNSTAQAGVYLGELGKLKILLPSFEEQQKIAAVLTNADQEIELLEQQLADLQQEKKALMQVLLTGKKRVLVDGEVA